MPRKPRFNLPDHPQHIIQRGNNCQPCFFSDQDYRHYLEDLKEAAEQYECHIHAYVLMHNHVHLLATPGTRHSISSMMQSLGRRYVYYFNNTYNRSGTLWQGRYKSSLIDSEHYLLTCMQYIELNPVRANLVLRPADYPWSSYRTNAGYAPDRLVHPHPMYCTLGTTAADRQDAYKALFNIQLDKALVQMIRDSLNHELVLGSSRFKDKIETITKRQTRLGQPGRPKIKEQQASYVIY